MGNMSRASCSYSGPVVSISNERLTSLAEGMTTMAQSEKTMEGYNIMSIGSAMQKWNTELPLAVSTSTTCLVKEHPQVETPKTPSINIPGRSSTSDDPQTNKVFGSSRSAPPTPSSSPSRFLGWLVKPVGSVTSRDVNLLAPTST